MTTILSTDQLSSVPLSTITQIPSTLLASSATISAEASSLMSFLGTTYFPSATSSISATTYFPSETIYASGSPIVQNVQQANPLLSRGALAATIVGALVGASLIFVAVFFLCCRRQRYRPSPSDRIETPPVREFNQPQSAKPGHRTSELPPNYSSTKHHEMATKISESAELGGNFRSSFTSSELYDEDVNTFATSEEKKTVPSQCKSDQSVPSKTFSNGKVG